MTTEKQLESINERLNAIVEKLDRPQQLAVTAPEAAKMLGLSLPVVRDLTHREGFPVLWVGSRVLISVEGLREWVKQQTGGAE